MSEIEETVERKSRRGNHYGSLRLRGRTFWARWKYKGRTFERSTGVSIDTTRATERAMKKLEEFTAPFRLVDERDFQSFMSMKLKSLGELVVDAAFEKRLTLGEAYNAFARSPRRRKVCEDTLSQYRALAKQLADRFGANTSMRDITQTAAENYAIELGESVSNLTFNNSLAKISYMWNVLSPQIGTSTNPWKGITYKPDDSQSRMPLTNDEIAVVLSTAGNKHNGDSRLMVIIAKNTGMRIGDCVKLKWRSIDLKNNFIRVKTRKTGAEVSIPILKELRVELEKRAKGRVADDPVLPILIKKFKSISTIMNNIFRKAGIQTAVERKSAGRGKRPYKTFHSLRANFITMCAESGIPLDIVKAVVGHTTVKMTEHYTHIRENAVKAAFANAGIG